eukprot:1273545-Prymnesium_polylepis.1
MWTLNTHSVHSTKMDAVYAQRSLSTWVCGRCARTAFTLAEWALCVLSVHTTDEGMDATHA